MSKEREMIELISRHMPKCPEQLNRPFESDAEIVGFAGTRLAYNIDEFSEEDLLRDDDPYILGWNMAVGCISDILASGGTPKFYAHSLVIKKSWTKEYVEQLALGIAAVLTEAGVCFIGGDFGISDTWRYTGSVIGQGCERPMFRNGAKTGDNIFISGKIGIGNIEAAQKLYSENSLTLIKKISDKFRHRFRLRLKESSLIREFSSCCIDTSDGVFNALNTISEMSKTGFEVTSLPYEKSGLLISKILSLPKELLFLGECGEYELLFTISEKDTQEFIGKSKEMGLMFYQIGTIRESGVKLLNTAGSIMDFGSYNISARDYDDKKNYLKDVLHFIR